MKWVLDLCSGLGGASESFLFTPNWRVVRVENNPELAHVEYTRLLDVNEWMDWLPGMIAEWGPPHLVIAAPPCTQFSRGYSSPREIARREGWDYQPDMTVLESCLEIIEHCQMHGTHWWIVENVIGAIPDFAKYLEEPRQIIGPFVLWGVFPYLNLRSRDFKNKKSKQDVWSSDPLRSNKKAKWPIELSQEVLDGVQWQNTLIQWT